MPTPEGISDHDPRWRLRLLDESDAEDLYAAVDANRDHLARWLPWAAGQTLEGTLAFIRSTRRQLATNDGFQTAIVEDGRIIGMVGFHGVSWDHRSATIGYWLAEAAQGRGIMTRAVRALANYAFTVWELNRVEIRAAVDNGAEPLDSGTAGVSTGRRAPQGRARRRSIRGPRRLRDAGQRVAQRQRLISAEPPGQSSGTSAPSGVNGVRRISAQPPPARAGPR